MINDKNKELWVQRPGYGEQWVSTSERLPENCEDVLICDVRDAFIAVGFLDDGKRWVCRDWFFDRDEITHWMPLPGFPKTEDDNES